MDKNLFISPEMLRLVRAERCQRRFWTFVQAFWRTVVPEDPVWNWHMEMIADEMQAMAERIFRGEPKLHDLIINVPPGSSKSTIASIMFPAWVWTRMRSFRTICASYSFPLAIDLASRSRDVVLSQQFSLYFPELALRDDTRGKAHFKNTMGGSRYATSVGGTVTGMHAHCHLVDDPLDPSRAVSEPELRTANNWMERTLPTRSIDKAVCPTILIMQRLHEDDPTGHTLAKAAQKDSPVRVKHLCFPATDSDKVRPAELRKKYAEADGYLDKRRLGEAVLKEQKLKLGSWGFASQYDQHPVPLEGGMFKVDRLVRLPATSRVQWRYVKRAVRYWDKGASEGVGSFTVGVLLLEMDTDHCDWPPWVIADVKRGQWSVGVRDEQIRTTALGDGQRVRIVLEQEPGGGGKADAQHSIRSLAGFTATKDKVQTAKELRALPFAAQVEARNVGVISGLEWWADYINEMSLYPMSKTLDQIDASSGAFNSLVGTGGLTW